jgi:hypothetical protein
MSSLFASITAFPLTLPTALIDNAMNSPSPSLSSASCEACGWAAALLAALAFGSFGVPIKSHAAQSVRIDPLVFQSYKTAMCLLTCFPILFLVSLFDNYQEAGTDGKSDSSESLFTFTPWGIVSGLFWVPGGVATVYAVQSAGLAMGIGIGSSFIVLVSFVWGIFLFDEPIHSRDLAALAVLCMMAGLLGMSYYSAPPAPHDCSLSPSPPPTASSSDEENDNDNYSDTGSRMESRMLDAARLTINASRSYSGLNVGDDDAAELDSATCNISSEDERMISDMRQSGSRMESFGNDIHSECDNLGIVRFPSACVAAAALDGGNSTSTVAITDTVVLGFGGCRAKIARRHAGMLSAAFCGLWGGSITAPMTYAPPGARGARYLMSFAIGASLVNLALWALRLVVVAFSVHSRNHLDHHRHPDQVFISPGHSSSMLVSLAEAYRELPSFHFRVMWRPGGLSGLLWSIGNFFSLLSVFYLGEGVGYPLVQTSILVSGLWGLFYYQEVTGTERRARWFASSLLTVFGILLLSYEHHEK